jgi:hypothetical protein
LVNGLVEQIPVMWIFQIPKFVPVSQLFFAEKIIIWKCSQRFMRDLAYYKKVGGEKLIK